MGKIRKDNSKRFYFQTIADHFENLDNPYDVNQRKNIVFNEFLINIELKNKLVLDAGCGYGAFSIELAKKECRLISSDIIQELTRKTVNKTDQSGAVADAICLPFLDETFDVVVSSEMVEHTPNPTITVLELLRVTKQNGYLILTTPNKKWQSVVRTASFLRLRNFYGTEIFLGFKQLERIFNQSEVEIIRHKGFHLFPFQLKFLWNTSKDLDKKYGDKYLGQFMINQAIFIRKFVRGEVFTDSP